MAKGKPPATVTSVNWTARGLAVGNAARDAKKCQSTLDQALLKIKGSKIVVRGVDPHLTPMESREINKLELLKKAADARLQVALANVDDLVSAVAIEYSGDSRFPCDESDLHLLLQKRLETAWLRFGLAPLSQHNAEGFVKKTAFRARLDLSQAADPYQIPAVPLDEHTEDDRPDSEAMHATDASLSELLDVGHGQGIVTLNPPVDDETLMKPYPGALLLYIAGASFPGVDQLADYEARTYTANERRKLAHNEFFLGGLHPRSNKQVGVASTMTKVIRRDYWRVLVIPEIWARTLIARERLATRAPKRYSQMKATYTDNSLGSVAAAILDGGWVFYETSALWLSRLNSHGFNVAPKKNEENFLSVSLCSLPSRRSKVDRLEKLQRLFLGSEDVVHAYQHWVETNPMHLSATTLLSLADLPVDMGSYTSEGFVIDLYQGGTP